MRSSQTNRAACRLCGADTARAGELQLLGRHDVAFFACPSCELLQTEKPYWLAEAYTKAMTALDTGAVARNQMCTRLTALIAHLAEIPTTATCLDFGGGHGVFARMMRDAGYDFRWFDKYADNLYASGFEADVGAHHALVTSFEVLEHLDAVGTELEAIFGPRPDHVLVGTVLHRGFDPSWWYLMPDSGQHVAFYTRRTLQWLADRFDYDVLVGPEYSLFRRRDLALSMLRRNVLANVLRRPQVALDVIGLVPEIVRRRLGGSSRADADHLALRTRSGS